MRCPQYSALGKLFAPLPVEINGQPASLFDMFLVTLSQLPGQMDAGMLLVSGDVTLLFDSLQCRFGGADAAVLSFRENVQIAKNHGVYLANPKTGNVKRFLHKQSPEALQSAGAVDTQDRCAIDTGAIWLSSAVLERLFATVERDEDYRAIVNEKVRLSLYGDIAYCLAEDSSCDQLLREAPEGEDTPELAMARRVLWRAIGQYRVKLLSLSPAKFIHFGSVPEVMNSFSSQSEHASCFGGHNQIQSVLPKEIGGYLSYALPGSRIGKGSYLEYSCLEAGASVGKGCYLSFIRLTAGQKVPDSVLLHGVQQKDGKFVCRMMDVRDNPKSDLFFGIPLEEVGRRLGIVLSKPLWKAQLFPVCDTARQAVDAALLLYELVVLQKGDASLWHSSVCKSLQDALADADQSVILSHSRDMQQLVLLEQFSAEIRAGKSVIELANLPEKWNRLQPDWHLNRLQCLSVDSLADFSHSIRLYLYLGSLLQNTQLITGCYRLIANAVCRRNPDAFVYDPKLQITRPEVTVFLPLRVNWGGGWTDTCPYCLEQGGLVLNVAITLNGQYPVSVRIRRITEQKIILQCEDNGAYGEFTALEPLQQTGDPFDTFALQKACLVETGIIPRTGGQLQQVLSRLGGGFLLQTQVTNVPKGSGLGTSSILSAATVTALYRFTGREPDMQKVSTAVLTVEQLMSTGGGWQDQVGGLVPGVKLITSSPGLVQQLQITPVVLSEQTKQQLCERFALIYTGQRRLARNTLRRVTDRYIGNVPENLTAHARIKALAKDMAEALQSADVDGFADLLNTHWQQVKLLDESSTNPLIERIFQSVEDLIDGKMCCGAGGGGFLQVILKNRVSKQELCDRLKQVFPDCPVDVWPCELLFAE